MFRRTPITVLRRAYATGPLPTGGAGAPRPATKKPDNTPIILGIVAAVGVGAYFLSGSGQKEVKKVENQAKAALGK